MRTTARRLVAASVAALGVALGAAGCGLDVAASCARAGGAYRDGICERWSAGQQAAREACESRGGVYLTGQDSCAYGMGGP